MFIIFKTLCLFFNTQNGFGGDPNTLFFILMFLILVDLMFFYNFGFFKIKKKISKEIKKLGALLCLMLCFVCFATAYVVNVRYSWDTSFLMKWIINIECVLFLSASLCMSNRRIKRRKRRRKSYTFL